MASQSNSRQTLDPDDWDIFRRQAHDVLDFCLNVAQQPMREQPTWRAVPAAARAATTEIGDINREVSLDQLLNVVQEHVVPYTMGNRHPRFGGWFIGAGTPLSIISALFEATMNTSVAGYEQSATYLELATLDWLRVALGLDAFESGVLLSGTSMATLTAVHLARVSAGDVSNRSVLLTEGAHNSVLRALRIIGFDAEHIFICSRGLDGRVSPLELLKTLEAAVVAVGAPFLIVGTAGTVDYGAFDDFTSLSTLANESGAWLHIDGAFGMMLRLVDTEHALLRDVESADSIAFDVHKWPHINYDAGVLFVREMEKHQNGFASPTNYLAHFDRGPSAHPTWFPDLGPELSRPARALKIWLHLRHFGRKRLGDSIANNCMLAKVMENLLTLEGFTIPRHTTLNIVCFRYGIDDDFNRELLQRVQVEGICLPSSTVLDGRFCLRFAVVNHRTSLEDIETAVMNLASARNVLAADCGFQPG